MWQKLRAEDALAAGYASDCWHEHTEFESYLACVK